MPEPEVRGQTGLSEPSRGVRSAAAAVRRGVGEREGGGPAGD